MRGVKEGLSPVKWLSVRYAIVKGWLSEREAHTTSELARLLLYQLTVYDPLLSVLTSNSLAAGPDSMFRVTYLRVMFPYKTCLYKAYARDGLVSNVIARFVIPDVAVPKQLKVVLC